MTIDEVFRFVDFISNKNQTGTPSPSQFNQMAERAQWEYFERDYKVWQSTQEITDALHTFLKTTPTSVPATGQLLFPSDYLHTTSIRHYYVRKDNTGIEVPVKEINNDEIGDVMQSEIVKPTLRYPVCSYYGTYIQFEPKNIGLITFDYLRKPVTPVWAFTTVNNRAVYNAAASIDFELPNETHNTLVMMMCSYLGINLQEGSLVQYAEMQKQQQP